MQTFGDRAALEAEIIKPPWMEPEKGYLFKENICQLPNSWQGKTFLKTYIEKKMFLKECYFIFMDLALDGHRQLQTNFSTLACDKIILLKE